MSLLPQSGGIGGWHDVGMQAVNLLGNWALSRAQARAMRRAANAQARAYGALYGATQGGGPVLNITPGIGASSGLSVGAPPAWQNQAAWQTAPPDVFGGGGVSEAGVLPAVLPALGAAGAAVARGLPAIVRAVQRAFPSLAGGAAVALASALAQNGFSSGGPYRSEAGNKAIAYRGDLAACRRLRKAGQAIGYARATGMRRSLRGRKRC
jgi:hypothetical protein